MTYSDGGKPKKILEDHGIEALGDVEGIIHLFRNDRFIFKEFLKELIFARINFYLPKIDRSEVVDVVFPRRLRYGIVRELEEKN